MGLFKPAWMSEDQYKALRAVGKLTDQAELARVAKEALVDEVRCAAIERLTDQNVLADMAKRETATMICNVLVKKLNDQRLLVDIVKNAESANSRIVAVAKLTDKTILDDIANKDDNWTVRMKAAETLNDKSLYDNIKYTYWAINKNISYKERVDAVRKITSQKMLFNIAANYVNMKTTAPWSKDHSLKMIRREAIEQITDTTLLQEIVNGNENCYVFVELGYAEHGYVNTSYDLREVARERLAGLQKKGV